MSTAQEFLSGRLTSISVNTKNLKKKKGNGFLRCPILTERCKKMEYKINPMAFAGIFPVPNTLVDDNIRLASVVQLKVLLYMLRHNGEADLCSEKISEALSIDKDDVNDAMIFWNERGLLVKDGQQVKAPVTAETYAEKEDKGGIPEPKPEPKKVADIPISRPTHEQIAVRLKESEEIAALFQEAQTALGKTVGYDGQSVLLMMHDSYGLPVEVILMAIEYAVSQKKTSYTSISRIGKRWSELEIDTLEGAMEYIEEHNIVDETWNKLRSMTEITNRNPTEKQRKYLTAWVKEYGYNEEIIYYAYEECIDRTGKMSMPYMDKIIRTWHEKGVKTVSDIQNERIKWEAEKEKRFAPKGKKEEKKKSDASYDIDAYMEKALNLNYVKNGGDNNGI